MNLLRIAFITSLVFIKTSFALDLPPKAELEKGPLKVEHAFVVNPLQKEKQLVIEISIAPYYYLYQNKIYLKSHQDADKLLPVKFVGDEIKINDDFFGEMLIYQNQLNVVFDLSKLTNLSNAVYLDFQGCWQGGICYPPQEKKIKIDSLLESSGNDSSLKKVNFSFSEFTQSYSNQNYFSEVLENYSLWLIIPIFLLLGFLLSFTPCVLPTFPLVYSVILQKNKTSGTQSQLRNFYLTLTFVISSALTYALAGMIVGLLGEKIQFLLQQDWVNLLAIVLMIFLATSMFGFYSIQIPRWIQNKANDALINSKLSYYFGASLMGVFSALIIGPCLAPPLAGVLIFLTHYGSLEVGALALFMLGIGMGLPLILFSSSLSHLFKERGQFMIHIERLFGYLILLVAIYLADRLLADRFILLLYGIVLIALANELRLMQKRVKKKMTKWLIKIVMGFILIIGVLETVGFFINAKYATFPLEPIFAKERIEKIKIQSEQKIITINLSELSAALNVAKKNNKIALVKFTADWCISCKVIEQEVFENEKVLERIKDKQIIEVDISEVNHSSSDLLDFYNLSGPPAIYFYDQSGMMRADLTMIGSVRKNDFLNNLNIIEAQ